MERVSKKRINMICLSDWVWKYDHEGWPQDYRKKF